MIQLPSYLSRNARRLRREATDAERLLWRHLRGRGLEGLKFRRQQPIGQYIVDFCCLDSHLVVEVDGGQHVAAIEEDRLRTLFRQRRGFAVVRIWNDEVLLNLTGVLEEIHRQAERASGRPDPDPLPRGEGATGGGGLVKDGAGEYPRLLRKETFLGGAAVG